MKNNNEASSNPVVMDNAMVAGLWANKKFFQSSLLLSDGDVWSSTINPLSLKYILK